jgi:predicted nucleic acid-binding protein
VAHYLDTSAIFKLVVSERESPALRDWLTTADRQPTSSDLARTELVRAVRRQDGKLLAGALVVLEALDLQTIDRGTFESAALLDPVPLRPLDAIHLACAMNLEEDLESIVTYDDRLAEAARAYGIAVSAPS